MQDAAFCSIAKTARSCNLVWPVEFCELFFVTYDSINDHRRRQRLQAAVKGNKVTTSPKSLSRTLIFAAINLSNPEHSYFHLPPFKSSFTIDQNLQSECWQSDTEVSRVVFVKSITRLNCIGLFYFWNIFRIRGYEFKNYLFVSFPTILLNWVTSRSNTCLTKSKNQSL